LNGFIGGTATSPIAVTTAGNISESYATSSATTGDTRLSYNKLTFTSTGSGETLRAFSVVTGTGAATAGTINGAHISTEINGAGASISGAANAIRATLGGTDTTPGGTLAVLQLDTNFGGATTISADSAFIRVTDSGTAGQLTRLMNVASGTTLFTAGTTGTLAGGLKIRVGSTDYFLMCTAAISA
jgi:hypothetical protein